MIHDPNNRRFLGERYGRSPISLFAGFLTYRYARLYTQDLEALFSPSIASPANLKALVDRRCVLDFTIRNEHLEDDLVRALNQCGILLNEEQLDWIHSLGRTNASSRRRDLGYYYDRSTVELVHNRDRILIDIYGYAAPELG